MTRIMLVGDYDAKSRILSIIGDIQAISILEQFAESSKSVTQVSILTQLPLSSVYKKVQLLLEAGLLYRERFEITEDGRKVEFFKSCISEIKVGVKDEDIQVDLIPNEPVMNRMWIQRLNSPPR